MNKYLQTMLDRVSNAYDKLVGSYFYDLLLPPSVELERIDAENLAMLDRGMADTATGDDLDRVVGEIGLTRKTGTAAAVTLRFFGADGTVIPAGTIVRAAAADYQTSVDGTISGGYVGIPAVCTTASLAGNALADTITSTTLSGITVTNPDPATGGTNPEPDEELRARYYYEVQHPPGSGNPYDYVRWAMEVDGCRAAKCIPLWAGAGTVKTIIIGQDGTTPESLREAVAAYIETKRPVGADVTVVGATPVLIHVAAALCYSDGFTAAEMQDAAMEVIADYLDSIAFQGKTVSYAHIGARLLTITGVTDYDPDTFTINGGNENIPIADDEIAMVGSVILNA